MSVRLWDGTGPVLADTSAWMQARRDPKARSLLLAGIERGDTGHRGYIGYIDEEPASVGRLYVHPESWFAGLYGGGTGGPPARLVCLEKDTRERAKELLVTYWR